MEKIDFDLKQYESDFEDLRRYEADAVADLKRVEHLHEWQPTDYERYYLPGLRLTGIREKDRIVLQNVADLHMHTQWSDGDDLNKVLDRALDRGLDAIAITDHDEIEGAMVVAPDTENLPNEFTFKSKEEKETDVNIAVKMMEIAFFGDFDRFYIISGDSDFVPAVRR